MLKRPQLKERKPFSITPSRDPSPQDPRKTPILVSFPTLKSETKCILSIICQLSKTNVSVSHPFQDSQFVERLPYSVRVLLESAVRNCDEFNVKQADVERILDWVNTSQKDVEIPFKPARVLLQDFTYDIFIIH